MATEQQSERDINTEGGKGEEDCGRKDEEKKGNHQRRREKEVNQNKVDLQQQVRMQHC